jgi:hypothetical protein
MMARDPNVAVASAKLAHDVGKYVARTARNIVLDGNPLPAAVLDMLCKDLYALPRGGRASALFASLSAALPDAPILDAARALLQEADALEPSLRAGDPIAIARAVEITLAVEDSLRAFARSMR